MNRLSLTLIILISCVFAINSQLVSHESISMLKGEGYNITASHYSYDYYIDEDSEDKIYCSYSQINIKNESQEYIFVFFKNTEDISTEYDSPTEFLINRFRLIKGGMRLYQLIYEDNVIAHLEPAIFMKRILPGKEFTLILNTSENDCINFIKKLYIISENQIAKDNYRKALKTLNYWYFSIPDIFYIPNDLLELFLSK